MQRQIKCATDVEYLSAAFHQQKILGQMGSLESKVVLDVGSGTGFFLKALSDRVGPRGLVVATDLAEGMCDRLRERIAEEAIRNAIVYVLLVVTVHL